MPMMKSQEKEEGFGDILLPAGYKFVPTDEELVTYYLINKALLKPIPAPSPFREILASHLYTTPPNLLVQNNPGGPSCSSGEREWFFFIHLDVKEISNAEDGQGLWQSNGGKNVFDENKNLLAFKIDLIYYSGSFMNRKKTHWSMDEYRLPVEFYTHHKLKEEWAVARLKRGKDYDFE